MKVKNLYRDVTKRGPIRTISVHIDPFLVVKHLFTLLYKSKALHQPYAAIPGVP